MTLKSWVLGRVHRMGGLAGRGDLPARTAPTPSPRSPRPPLAPDSVLTNAEHLGPYAALIGAIRAELEHFVAGHVRLHLAIADRDRFVLTSIGVRCPDDGQARDLLAQFTREFKPEQVKRYLVREVIAGLPNASALDLSQFAGLFDAETTDDATDYRELLVALRGNAPAATAAAYQVSVVGRWSELDVASPIGPASGVVPTPATPLAGQRHEFEIEDASGRRRVVLQSVVAGRRYVIGKGEGCDIRVNGTYTSRRHGELWLEDGAWWVSDAGSTNGLRVETAGGSVQRCGAGAEALPILLLDGARIVLSAQTDGAPSDYPTVMLRPPSAAMSRVTPIAVGAPAPTTPLTPIIAARGASGALTLTARLATGERRLALHAGVLPVAVGRSRNQQLVVDRVHESVSGHHLDIVDVDEHGAQVVVHGDNGVIVEGVAYPAGARLRWKVGDTMVLGPALQGVAECTLVLSR